MKVKCLSVKNPISYLICSGIKDVENRTWKTNYRGKIYIHSSGPYAFDLLPESIFPKILKKELNAIEYKDDAAIIQDSEHVEIINKIIDLTIFANKGQKPFFIPRTIIGYVDLVDIVKNSKSIWAQKNCYHWILKNPVMLKSPIKNVRGKLNIFELEVSDA